MSEHAGTQQSNSRWWQPSLSTIQALSLQREVADVTAQSIGKRRNEHQNPHVVNAAPHMKDRRNAERAAYLFQAGPRQIECAIVFKPALA